MRRSKNRTSVLLVAAVCLVWAGTATPAAASDGGAAASGPTYYEEVLGSGSLEDLETQAGGLPTALHVVEAAGGIEYQVLSEDASSVTWQVSLEVAERNHERVDAVYDLVLALPLPADTDGVAAFETDQWAIDAREGTPGASVALIYGGEKLTLKRNVALERAWLPTLQASPDGLPDLAGTGYIYTLWDTVLRYDPGYGDRVQGLGTLTYVTGTEVVAPDPEDQRNAGYVITWIPTLDPSVPPFTIRLDVRPPAPE
jgi:hypothetical protein